MQYVKSMTSLLIFCCRLLDGPQHMSFRVGAGPAITKNKLNNNKDREQRYHNQLQTTLTKNTDNIHEQKQ